MWLELTDGILYCEYKQSTITLKDAIEITNYRNKFVNNQSYPALITSYKKVEIDKLAREYFKTPESNDCLKAIALLYEKSYTKILANFMIRLHKPPMPIRIFNSEEQALIWLNQFK